MRSVIVSVIALAGTALAGGPPGGDWGSSTTGWSTTPAAVSTWSSSPAASTWTTSAAPYPVPGGNSSMSWGATATQAPPATTAAPVCSEYVDGQPQCATSASAPAPSAPAATGAAGALTVGFSGAILAGIAAFVL